MRTFTTNVGARKFTVNVGRRLLYGESSNWVSLETPDESSWVVVGTPQVTLRDILGTLGRNIISPGSGLPAGVPPAGYNWLIDESGNYIVDGDGNYILVPG